MRIILPSLFCVLFLVEHRALCTSHRSRQGVVSTSFDEPKGNSDEESKEEREDAEDQKEKESEAERETEEMDFSLATKNLEGEISHREQIQAQDRKAAHEAEDAIEKIEAKPPACSVQKTGKLLIATDPMDVLSVGAYAATMTKRHFTVHYPDHPEKPFIKFPIIEIKTPIETLRRSRRCFRLFHKDTPRLFCTESNAERNDWIKDIYKAIFCINTGVQAPEGQAAEPTSGGALPTWSQQATTSSTPIEIEKGKEVTLPAKSTKVQRWIEQQTKQREKMLQEAEAGEISEKGKQKGVPEIEITAGQFGQPPKVSVNGDDIAVPSISAAQHNMNEGAMGG